jgi:disulfide bond formation protein DsbB
MKNKNVLFWIFAPLKNISLGVIIFLLFNAFGKISNTQIIGLDTLIWLSVLFPLLTLIVEYIFFDRIKNRG